MFYSSVSWDESPDMCRNNFPKSQVNDKQTAKVSFYEGKLAIMYWYTEVIWKELFAL